MVVDENGDKMSKTKGNGDDPLDLVHGATFDQIVDKSLPGAPREEAVAKFKKSYPSMAKMAEGFPAFGADALRFTFNSYSPQAKRILLAPKRIEGYRHFCNKIWNAVRFALPYLETHASAVGAMSATPKPTWRANRWILSRLAAAIAEVDAGLNEFRLDEASGALYRFFWDEFCSWYLEIAKPVFQDDASSVAGEVAATMAHVLEASMRALHPFMPFITEELWQRLPRPASRPESIVLAPFPTAADGRTDTAADREMDVLTSVISAARTIRSEHEVHPGAQVPLVLRAHDPQVLELFRSELVTIRTLVKTEGDAVIETSGGGRPPGSVMSVVGDVEVLVGLRGLVEAGKETDRVEREIRRTDKDLAALEKKLSSPAFVEKAKPEIVAETKAQVEALRRTRARLEEARQLASELA
jgi:valyl-tRNA synthetase